MAEVSDQFEIYLEGQSYRLAGREPYTKANGQLIDLLVWESRCATCGNAFHVKTTTKVFKAPNRRCIACKTAGVRVKKRRAKAQESLVETVLCPS